MELQTAQRLGYTTSLRWLQLDGLRIVGVVDHEGKEHRDLKSPKDLCKYYTSVDGTHPPTSLFTQYQWQGKTPSTPCEDIKTDPEPQQKKPKNEKKPKKDSKKGSDIKESTTTMAEPRDNEQESTQLAQGQVAFEKGVDIVHELLGHHNGELKYLMEFEDWDDLVYRYNKLKEKIPEYSYSYRTKRAVVTYGKLE